MTEVEAYHEMYLTMARAAEQAIRLLVEAQQTCETLYVESTEQAPRNPDYKKSTRGMPAGAFFILLRPPASPLREPPPARGAPTPSPVPPRVRRSPAWVPARTPC